MPRYFFDISDGEHSSRDETGVVLPGLAAARDEAQRVLPDITREVMPDGNDRVVTLSIRDETGAVVFRATLSLHCTTLGPLTDDQG